MAAPLDLYSPCPGGTGKKIRFCCAELLPELHRIERMLDGHQWHACLEHIERLQRNYPDRACLFALKGIALFELRRPEELKANAQAFMARHPDNPLAHAEVACAFAEENTDGSRAAIAPLLKALSLCRDDGTHKPLERHLDFIGYQLMESGFSLAARALREAWGGEKTASQFDPVIPGPLWYREARPLAPCPADFPWKADFDQALEHARSLRWFEAEREFSALAARANGTLAVWQNLMVLRGWLGDMAGSAEAARRCAALVTSDDDAAEFEAYAAYSTNQGLGDWIRIPVVGYVVTDAEALGSALERDAAITPLEIRYKPHIEMAADRPKSEKWYRLVGPPAPPAGVPEWACLLILSRGNQEQPARLVVRVFAPEVLPQAQRRVESIGGEALGSSQPTEPAAEESVTQLFLQEQAFLLIGAPQWRAVVAERQRTFVRERWPKIPLGLLDGKSFEEATADGTLRRRALAALLLLEHLLGRPELAGEEVRKLVGLPPRDPIDPGVIPVESVPVARLHLVDASKLRGRSLEAAFERALRFLASAAMVRLGPALAHDDSVPWSPIRVEAAVLALQLEPNFAQVLARCQRWRQEARQVPGACAKFDLEEAYARLLRGELEDVINLLRHLTSEHSEQPGVAEAVENFRAALEAFLHQARLLAKKELQPSIIAPDGGQPGKLWTPDSARQQGTKPTLWTPGNP